LGVRLSLFFTAENAENAEGFILKQRATTTKSFHRRERWERRGADVKRLSHLWYSSAPWITFRKIQVRPLQIAI